MLSFLGRIVATCFLLVLFACGGGGGGSSSTDAGDNTPLAVTGADQSVKTNSLVTLDGSSSSDPQGGFLSYVWLILEKPDESQATLSDALAVKPTFTPDVDGVYIIALVVSNGDSESEEVLTTITASTANSAPVANAGGERSVIIGDLVTLDASGSSDADGDQVTYLWIFDSKPAGSTATLSTATAAKPTFMPDVVGDYVLLLVVSDGIMDSTPTTVTITVVSSNVAPVAKAGTDKNVNIGNLVTLDGSGSSDADGDQLSYSWSFVFKPLDSVTALSDVNSVVLTFTPDVVGDYVVRLVVSDGVNDSLADTVTISVSSDNSAPVADAGSDRSVGTADLVNLDGSGSFDADDDILSYFWSFKSLPNGSNATLSDPLVSNPTFYADLEGNYVLDLIVNDGVTDSLSDTITITATTPPPLEISEFAKWPYNLAEIKYDWQSDGSIDWIEEFTYDESGNVLTFQMGTEINYYNYENDLLTSIVKPYGTETFTYLNGNIVEHVGTDSNSKYEYLNEKVYRVVTEYDGGYETIDYTYNEYGMTTSEHIKWYNTDGSLSYEDLETYSYGIEGRLVKISCPHEVTDYFYDESGALKRYERRFDQTYVVANIYYDDNGTLTKLDQSITSDEYSYLETYYFTFNEHGFPSEYAGFGYPSFGPSIYPTIHQFINWVD